MGGGIEEIITMLKVKGARPLLNCPSTLIKSRNHCQLVSKVIRSFTDLRQPQFCREVFRKCALSR